MRNISQHLEGAFSSLLNLLVHGRLFAENLKSNGNFESDTDCLHFTFKRWNDDLLKKYGLYIIYNKRIFPENDFRNMKVWKL